MYAAVDAQVGLDVAQPGFCLDVDIGKRRKVTIYSVLCDARLDKSLSEVCEYDSDRNTSRQLELWEEGE